MVGRVSRGQKTVAGTTDERVPGADGDVMPQQDGSADSLQEYKASLPCDDDGDPRAPGSEGRCERGIYVSAVPFPGNPRRDELTMTTRAIGKTSQAHPFRR